MERLRIDKDIPVIGFQVKSFPEGIGEAFDSLVEKVPDGLNRPYYGISFVADNKIIYRAAAAELIPGEAERYGYERYIIKQGEYEAITVTNWRTKTDIIKDVFATLMRDGCPDESQPCIEWYKDDEEMVCMVRKVNVTIKS